MSDNFLNATIKFAKVNENAKIPTFGRDGDGCMDVCACFEDDEFIIKPHTVRLVPTGICSTFPKNYRISIRERGSNTKGGMIVMAGQIDSNYTGKWFVAIYNGNDVPLSINKNTAEVEYTNDMVYVPYSKAIAQCAVEFVPQVTIEEVSHDYILGLETNRGDGCLGSSGQ